MKNDNFRWKMNHSHTLDWVARGFLKNQLSDNSYSCVVHRESGGYTAEFYFENSKGGERDKQTILNPFTQTPFFKTEHSAISACEFWFNMHLKSLTDTERTAAFVNFVSAMM